MQVSANQFVNVLVSSELESPFFGDADVERVRSHPSVCGFGELCLGTI